MDISIVIPAFNEEGNIEKVVEEAFSVLKEVSSDYEVLVVDDGSRDGTAPILDTMSNLDPRLRVIHHRTNQGAGSALKTCYTNANGKLVFFVPADGQVSAKELHKLLPFAKEAHAVVGCRAKRADPVHRKVFAFLYNLLIRLVFGLNVRDVDGIKLFKKEVFDEIVIESNSAFVEAEILIKTSRRGWTIREVEVEHFPRMSGKPSGARLKVVSEALLEVIRFGINARRCS